MKLTVKQAAERACVSANLIYQLCEQRRLPHFRIGGQGRRGKILIDPVDLEAFISSLKVEASHDDGEFRHASPARRGDAAGAS
jgi:excisionase family DNA binding protein